MTIVGSITIIAAPKVAVEKTKTEKVATECVAELEKGGTTKTCAEIIEKNFKGSPIKIKESIIHFIDQALKDKYPNPQGWDYINNIRSDMFKRIETKPKSKVSKKGVKLIRYRDILAQAKACIDPNRGNKDLTKCIEIINAAPFADSPHAKTHVVYAIDSLLKEKIETKYWHIEVNPFIRELLEAFPKPE